MSNALSRYTKYIQSKLGHCKQINLYGSSIMIYGTGTQNIIT